MPVLAMSQAITLPPRGRAGMMPAMSASDPRAAFKLRPRELFFGLVGVVGGAGAFVLWFKAVPEMMARDGVSLESLSSIGQLVLSRGFQFFVLVLTLVLLAGGVATRTSLGRDRATWILAIGASVVVVALVLSVYGLGDLLVPVPDETVRP